MGSGKKQRWSESETLAANVQRVLPGLARKWFAAGAAAMQDGVGWPEMHDFRLLTKRFRYTLEIFQPLYGPSLEVRVRQLRKLQTYLGEINDCITTLELVPADADEIRGALSARAEEKTAELRRFWAKQFEGEGRAAGWKQYLARYAGSAKQKS